MTTWIARMKAWLRGGEPARSKTKVCVVTTLRASPEETRMFLGYHRRAGIAHIVIFFDDPADPAYEAVRSLDGVTAIRCDADYWRSQGGAAALPIEERQVINANRGLAIARELACDWIIHLDGDELLWSKKGVAAALDAMDADVVRFAMNEALPETDDITVPFIQIRTFKKALSKERRQQIVASGCQDVLYRGKYFRGHNQSKSAVRVRATFASMGIHAPVDGEVPLSRGNTNAVTLLHYDSCNYEAWKTKWLRRIDGTGTAIDMRGSRVNQFEAFQAAAREGEEAMRSLYRSLYIFSPELRARLMEFGALVERTIPEQAFTFDTKRR